MNPDEGPVQEKPRRILQQPQGPRIVFFDEELETEARAIESVVPQQGPLSGKRSVAFSLTFSLIGATIWALVSFLTGYQVGIVAIVIGLLAGYGAARGGRGPFAQKVGAVSAGIGYFMGQWLLILFHSSDATWGPEAYTAFLKAAPEIFGHIARITFSGMDALFLGFAVYEGYRIPGLK